MNYKSFAKCDVSLRPLTVIVGRNGSGKSNFLDGLHFIADALQTSLEYAVRKRGGVRNLTHRRSGKRFGIEVVFRLPGREATYSLQVRKLGVGQEALRIIGAGGTVEAEYQRDVAAQQFNARAAGEELPVLPTVLKDRLALVALSGFEAFRDAYDALASMRFYRLNPDAMRSVQDPDEGEVLREDGSNLASVWGRLEQGDADVRERLMAYLRVIFPGIVAIRRTGVGPNETLYFQQTPVGRELEFALPAWNMSDGTLRAFGALVASRQSNSRATATLVGIEEPETALHPGAVAALMDALHEASAQTQIIITSHSPDLLDHIDMEADALLITESRKGATVIAEVGGAGREAIRRHLYTAGELLRMDQLQPDLSPPQGHTAE